MKKQNGPKLTQFMPILRDFDYASNPVGFVDLADERITLKVNAKEKVTTDDINSGKAVFAPSYIVTKDDNGIVQEIVVDSFSLLIRK